MNSECNDCVHRDYIEDGFCFIGQCDTINGQDLLCDMRIVHIPMKKDKYRYESECVEKCEGCNGIATKHDIEGIALCDECYESAADAD